MATRKSHSTKQKAAPAAQPIRHLFIKEHMDAKGLSDEDVADKLETNRETVYRWRTDQKRLNPYKQKALADALGIESEDFYRPPDQPSLDAMAKKADPELRKTIVRVVREMIPKQ